MKRSTGINIETLRKGHVLKPLSVFVGVNALLGCTDPNQIDHTHKMRIIECTNSAGLTVQECEVAYQQALLKQRESSRSYSSDLSCEMQHGANNCVRDSSTGMFLPFLAGMVTNEIFSNIGRRSDRHFETSGAYYPPNSRSYDRKYKQNRSTSKTQTSRNESGSYTPPPKPKAKASTKSRGGWGSFSSSRSSSSSSWGG